MTHSDPCRPGDYLPHDGDEISAFKDRLNERLAPTPGTSLAEEENANDWEIGDAVAQWWRPNFETYMYPFVPAHITRPKECKKLYMIQLPKSSTFLFRRALARTNIDPEVLSVPKNMKLLAVPLFELFDNAQRYGQQLSAIPHYLSRYNFEFVDENDQVISVTPGAGLAGVASSDTVTAKIVAGGEDNEINGQASQK